MNEKNNTSSKETVLEKIRTEELTMRPKSYFFVKVGLLIVLIVGVLLTSVFICDFMIFSIRINSRAPGFGVDSFLRFIAFFPWVFLIIDAIFISILEWLLRQFRFAYRVPVLRLLSLVLILTVLVSILVDRVVPLHDVLLNEADQHHLPRPINDFYEHARWQDGR